METNLAGAKIAWAKPGDESGYLSVWQHLVDARGVAECLWDEFVSESVKASIVASEDLALEDVRRLVVFLAATHDVGKMTRSFQLKITKIPGSAHASRILDQLEDAGLSLEIHPSEVKARYFPHGLASGVILSRWLRERNVWGPAAESIAMVVESHHGIPADAQHRGPAHEILELYPEAWRVEQNSLLEEMAVATGFDEVLPRISDEFSAPTIQILTGIVIVADWCASNESAFPYVYAGTQKERVEQGMEAIGLAGLWHAAETLSEDAQEYFAAAFGWNPSWAPRPIQQQAFHVARKAKGATLLIIEAPTGVGKTEAALAAAHVLAAQHGCHGVVFAAPTMATANGLFDRVVEWAQHVVPAGDITAMYLGHSKNKLMESYQRLRVRGVAPDAAMHGSVAALDWFASPKKGLLSNFAVATVDQILMLVLQTRHSMLRHLGLAGKVVIIDECHAYDAFMSAYLETTLSWLAWYEVPVILLSATLPVQKKQQLVRAYQASVQSASWSASDEGYPLITISDVTGVRESSLETPDTEIHAQVSVIDDATEALVELLETLLVDGGCALVVCNTIKRAQEAYLGLQQIFNDEVELHHAAFIASDRAYREGKLLEKLGPKASRGNGRPWRQIVVGTQVLEQSLDIDADVLITDMAPIDLLVQRAGRLARHTRPNQDRPETLQQASIYIRGMQISDGLPEFDAGTAAIYDSTVLLASAHTVLEKLIPHGYARPDDIASLVRNTYASVELEQAPRPDWQSAWQESRTESAQNYATAMNRSQAFRFPDPATKNYRSLFARYFKESGTAGQKEEALVAQVRDAEVTIEVIPIVRNDFGYRPWGSNSDFTMEDEAPNYKLAYNLAGATVRLPSRITKRPKDFERVIDQLEKETPVGWVTSHLLKGSVALSFNEDGIAELAGHTVTYSDEIGLVVGERNDK